jgi:hypothetical protein
VSRNFCDSTLAFWLLLFSAITGCAWHDTKQLNPDPVDAYRIRTTEAGITIAADVFHPRWKVEAAFTVDLNEHGYLPILLIIENRSGNKFQLRTADIELTDGRGRVRRPIPVEVMAQKLEHNPMLYGLIGFGILSYKSAESANKKMLDDWGGKELPPQSVLLPRRSTHGVVYFDLGQGFMIPPKSTLRLSFSNMWTGERRSARLPLA